jgi:4-amino-4-deoxy-L-arabinose transferase-like glycosyltransferase
MTSVPIFKRYLPVLAGPIGLVALIAFLFLEGAPAGGAYSWPDSPRHALNGAFILDLIKAAPIHDPLGYASAYYSQYPALTIGLYPPLFSFQLAIFYAIFGISQESAIIALFVSYCFTAYGVYALSRWWLARSLSFGVAVIFAFLPEIGFWGRQVMLEIPAYAFLVWSAYFFIRYLRESNIPSLYGSVFLIILGMYTKLSVAFIIGTYIIALLRTQGSSVLRNPHIYVIFVLSIIGIVPLAILTLKFGQANIQSVVGVADSAVSRLSLAGWTWYATKLPAQMGWPAAAAAGIAIVAISVKREWRRKFLLDDLVLVSWILIGYLFFSSIDLKEARHSVFLLLPPIIVFGIFCGEVSRWRRWAGEGLVGMVALATIVLTLWSRPVHYVDGYRDVAMYVGEVAPPNSNVLFSGYRDGGFIFEMRASAGRPDVSVIRADKLLLRVAVRRGLGVEEKNYDQSQIAAAINRLGVHYVVAQPGFWTDLEQMKRLARVLEGRQFVETKRFSMTANYPAQEKELVVYRNLDEVSRGPIKITNELPIVGREISGQISTGTGEGVGGSP